MMNKILSRCITSTLLFALLFSLPISLFSTTYTAVLSGDWTSAVTWGGSAPPATISGDDQIIITANVTVNLNTNVEVNNELASISILGSLEGNSNLTVTSGTVIGTGTLIVNELKVAAEGTVAMTGEITCETLETASNLLTISASTSVQAELKLMGGICQIDNSGSLMLASDATVEISGGELQNLGGSLTSSGSFNLLYSGSSTTTGDETTAGTIANLTINLSGNNETVTMEGDVTVTGELSLMTGNLSLNGFNLTLEGTSNAEAGATISGDANSSIVLNGSGNMGILVFAQGEEEVDDCTVSIENDGWITLNSELNVNGTLSLNSGWVNCADNNLTIAASGSVEGGSEDSYVMTSGEGSLIIYLEAGGDSAEFPVGTDEGYFPCILSENAGAADTDIAVRVLAGVFAEGETGADLTANEPLVNHTWIVSKVDANAQVDLDFEFFWHSTAEVNGFNNDNCYISHFINGSWDVAATAMASVEASGYFSISRDNITSLSPFRVADNMTAPTFEFMASDFKFYPNPAKEFLILEMPEGLKSSQAELFSLEGKLLRTFPLDNQSPNMLDIQDLPSGTYVIKLEKAQGIQIILE